MAQSLPPAVEFFLRETSDQPDVPGPFAAWLKRSGVSKELQARAEETIKQFKYADDRNTPVEPTGRFTVCPSGALDPMSPIGKCGHPNCRAEMAGRFARSLALYAESVVMTDTLTGLLYFGDLDSPLVAARLLGTRAAVRQLEPLLRAGIIRLGTPTRFYCAQHGTIINTFQQEARTRLTRDLLREVRYSLRRTDRRYYLTTTLADGELIVGQDISRREAASLRTSDTFVKPRPTEKTTLRPYIERDADQMIYDLFLSTTLAQSTHGTLAAADRGEVQAFTSLAGRSISMPHIDELERLLTISLPYVEDLTVREVLVLRRKAASALPRFRTFIARKVIGAKSRTAAQASILELKEGVADIQAELMTIRRGRNLKILATTTTAALALLMYESTTLPAMAVAAFAGALAAMNAIHPHVAKDETDAARQETLPAYILWKAHNLLAHRE